MGAVVVVVVAPLLDHAPVQVGLCFLTAQHFRPIEAVQVCTPSGIQERSLGGGLGADFPTHNRTHKT